MASTVIPRRIKPILRSSSRRLKHRPVSCISRTHHHHVHPSVVIGSFHSCCTRHDDSFSIHHQRHVTSSRHHHCYSTITINHIHPPITISSSLTTQQQQITKRHLTSLSSTIPTLTCLEYTPTLYGLTPFLLSTFHSSPFNLPYPAAISLTNILVRSSMIPLVIRGAKTSLSIGVVAPEVTYLITNFRKDFGMLKSQEKFSSSSSSGEGLRKAQLAMVRYTVESLRGIFKLHKVNLLDVFKSPLLQIPIFWYFALDLRQVINGADPILAQALVDTTFLHITDLTEPDPYYVLPIITGALLYFNVETAVGKRALSGETSSQSKLATALKDFFQSLAVFMPCFMSQQPSAVQIYLLTSMLFSLGQSTAMRNTAVREMAGLPPLHQKPKGMEEGKFVKEFMELMKERQEAKARGEFILGEGVLRLGATYARVGKRRESSIVVEESEEEYWRKESSTAADNSGDGDSKNTTTVKAVEIELPMYTLSSLLVNPDLFATRPAPMLQSTATSMLGGSMFNNGASPDAMMTSMTDIPIDVMEKANRGEKPVIDKPIEMAPKELLRNKKKEDVPLDVHKMKMKRSKQKGKGKKR